MSKTRSNTTRVEPNPDSLTSALSQAINRALTEGRLQMLDAAKQTDFAALVVERARASTAPQRMAEAQHTDAAAREHARASYERCLEVYRTMVRPLDTEYDDAGAALAFFVAANLNALHDVHTTAETLLLLERQLLAVAREGSEWDAAPITDRQFYFEQMAMCGVFVAGAVAQARQQGDAALEKARDAARGYLQRVLGMDPDLLTFGEHGLALRRPGAAPHSAA